MVRLKVEDYYPSGKRFLLRLKEKGGKEKELEVVVGVQVITHFWK